jgi:Ulp1 family protease
MVPQQDNAVDCGLFVIKFIEAVLKFPLPNFEGLTTYYYSKVDLSSTSIDEYRSHLTLILKEVDVFRQNQRKEVTQQLIKSLPMRSNDSTYHRIGSSMYLHQC